MKDSSYPTTSTNTVPAMLKVNMCFTRISLSRRERTCEVDLSKMTHCKSLDVAYMNVDPDPVNLDDLAIAVKNWLVDPNSHPLQC